MPATEAITNVYGLGLAAQQTAQGWNYPVVDGLGSIRRWVDGDEDQLYAASFAPFGEMTAHSGAAAKPWGYAGEYLEPASGLIYLRARWYDPVDGRFLTRDMWPGDIFHPQSLNGWSYVEGNPVNRVDPSGYCWGPVASLRNVPGYDTLCGNLDMAIFIAGNPNATAAERAFAVEYVELAVWSHVALVAGLTALGYGWMLEGLGAANQTYDIPDQCLPAPEPCPPGLCYPTDPTIPPGPEWTWHGSEPPGSSKGAWFNEGTEESMHPDFDHATHGPHWDYTDRRNNLRLRIYPDGVTEEK